MHVGSDPILNAGTHRILIKHSNRITLKTIIYNVMYFLKDTHQTMSTIKVHILLAGHVTMSCQTRVI